jgi:hypothetical protein
MFAPTARFILPAACIGFVMLGFRFMFWSLGIEPPFEAFRVSGSSLLTLGFAPVTGPVTTLLAFSEATIGLRLIALLIAYLPAIYSTFSQRATAFAMLEICAGSPPSAITLLERANPYGRLEELGEMCTNWEFWFTEIEKTHTSLTVQNLPHPPCPSDPGSLLLGPCRMPLRWMRLPWKSLVTCTPICASAAAIWPCDESRRSSEVISISIPRRMTRSVSLGRSSTRPWIGCRQAACRSRRTGIRRGEIMPVRS